MTASLHSLIGGLLLLCLSSLHPPQTDLLRQKVSVDYQNATLQEVLTDLQEQYGLKFAYLNNELPTGQSVTLNFQNTPLNKVLDTILDNTPLSYQLVNNQIVLKNDPEKALQPDPEPEIEKTSTPSQSSEAEIPTEASPDTDATASTNTNIIVAESSPAENDLPEKDNNSSDSDSRNGDSRNGDAENRYSSNTNGSSENIPEIVAKRENTEEVDYSTKVPLPSKDITPQEEEVVKVPPTKKEVEKKQSAAKRSGLQKKGEISKKITETIREGMNYAIFDNLPDESSYETRPLHVGFIYPLSTNGINAGQYVNRLSFHALIGYSAGLDGVEASGFGNVENDFVNGAQFAGFFNLVKKEVTGLQAAGFINLNGGKLEGGQFAGFLNTSLDSIQGIQGAGFLNLSTGATRGAQLAGFTNIATQDAYALQAAGFANVAASGMQGGQFAGFGNYAHDVNGAQFAGFMNIATGDVKGFQGSGFMNVARNVKGVQLSVFNVADSVDGVPIGLLSIVRKNGYRTLEVWGGETMHANVALKIGVRKFYNIFSFGSQFADTDFRYGIGYGVGHITALSPTIDLSIDLLAQQVYEDGNPIFNTNNGNQTINTNNRLNLLNTARLGFAKQFSRHFGVFVAPTFNVLVSEVRNTDGSIGSNLAPYTFFDETYNNRTNVQMWAGFNVGLRF
ncbi:MAG: secretin and TonB N-terminal domain-containing protein [Bacteroidota bacterium]